MFSAVLRTKFDPFEQHSNEEVWKCLGHAHLRNYVASLPGRLQHMCNDTLLRSAANYFYLRTASLSAPATEYKVGQLTNEGHPIPSSVLETSYNL